MLQVSALKNAAPVRFSTYTFLILGMMTAVWLANARLSKGLKAVAAAAIVVCLLPNLSSAYWNYPANLPAFFTTGIFREYLRPDETVFIFPFWPKNESMLWQALTDMYFKLGQGPGPWPKAVAKWPIIDALSRQAFVPDAPEQFKAYLAAQQTSVIIADEEGVGIWAKVLSSLNSTPIKAGGVFLYRIPGGRLPGRTDDSTLAELRARFDVERFDEMLSGTDDYLSRGGKIDSLIASDSVQLGILPPEKIVGPEDPGRKSNFRYGMALFVTGDNRIVIGEMAWRPVADYLIRRYRDVAADTTFGPKDERKDSDRERLGMLLMSFDRAGLGRAAAIARRSPSTPKMAELLSSESYSTGSTSATPRQ
jgi:hypothetical protein